MLERLRTNIIMVQDNIVSPAAWRLTIVIDLGSPWQAVPYNMDPTHHHEQCNNSLQHQLKTMLHEAKAALSAHSYCYSLQTSAQLN